MKRCYEKYGSLISTDSGGGGMLLSLSNVKRMDLLAHPCEVQYTHIAHTTAFNFYLLLGTMYVYFLNNLQILMAIYGEKIWMFKLTISRLNYYVSVRSLKQW